jgi:hypothetical protein
MLPKLILNTLRPVVERLGTGIAVYLIATGATEELAAQLANALVAACFFLVELAVVRFSRREVE